MSYDSPVELESGRNLCDSHGSQREREEEEETEKEKEEQSCRMTSLSV